jgi:hypothetical protein
MKETGLNEEKRRRSLEELNEAIERDPSDHRAYVERGNV